MYVRIQKFISRETNKYQLKMTKVHVKVSETTVALFENSPIYFSTTQKNEYEFFQVNFGIKILMKSLKSF